MGGDVLGGVASFGANYPNLAPKANMLNTYASLLAQQKVNNLGVGDAMDKPGPAVGGMANFRQGFLKGDTHLRNQLNDPNNPDSLTSKSWGAASINDDGSVNKNLGNVPGYALNKAEGWMGQHPWVTGIGGGLALTGLLASLLRRHQTQEQAPMNINISTQNGQTAPTHPVSPQFFGEQ